MEFLTLDMWGVVLAIVFGVLMLVLGSGLGAFFLLSMIVFLLLSAIVTYTGIKYKRMLKIGQEPRGIRNVMANGVPPIIMVVLFYAFDVTGNGQLALLAVIGFLASVAAITTDKFSSEIGVLNGTPYSIFSMKRVKKGTSGGITVLGSLAGLFAAFLVSLLVFFAVRQLYVLNGYHSFGLWKAIALITVSGFIGGLVDSVLGHYEEKGIGNKFTSNFACGIVAGFVAMALFAVL
ncbi:MAG: DUF92 domain-containing protein [Candidatus Micrarchaeota archaeon]|nr:DUF92 domain-containing protein [Candidatus Micrarchaeota archaeon]